MEIPVWARQKTAIIYKVELLPKAHYRQAGFWGGSVFFYGQTNPFPAGFSIIEKDRS